MISLTRTLCPLAPSRLGDPRSRDPLGSCPNGSGCRLQHTSSFRCCRSQTVLYSSVDGLDQPQHSLLLVLPYLTTCHLAFCESLSSDVCVRNLKRPNLFSERHRRRLFSAWSIRVRSPESPTVGGPETSWAARLLHKKADRSGRRRTPRKRHYTVWLDAL